MSNQKSGSTREDQSRIPSVQRLYTVCWREDDASGTLERSHKVETGPECDDLEFLPEIPDRGALARGGDAFNFIAIRNAIERWLGRPRDPENIAVIINADDILFPLATS